MLPLASGFIVPQWPFDVRQDGIGEGLEITLAPWAGLGFRNLSPGSAVTPTSHTIERAGIYGARIRGATATGYLSLTTPMSIAGGYTFRIVYDIQQSNIWSMGALSSTGFNAYLARISTTNTLGVYDTAGQAFSPAVWPTPTLGAPVDLIVTYDGTTARCYIDGVEKGSVAASLGLSVGRLLGNPSASRAWPSALLTQLWNRPLSAGEVAAISGPTKNTDALFSEMGRTYMPFGLTSPAAGGAPFYSGMGLMGVGV